MTDKLYSVQKYTKDGNMTERLVCGCVRISWRDKDGIITRTDFCKEHAKEKARQ